MELEREARKSRFARPNQLPDTEPVAPKLLREKAPDALEDIAPHIVPASPMMFGPNISGTWKRWGENTSAEYTGAFYESGTFTEWGGLANKRTCPVIGFLASRSNSVFGSSSSVQPPAMAALVLIKI